ncbi:MAG: PQQ-binding-like beta-propeller repeat protein, partial [Desulforhopalus sp.]|nr:PQQ-binding-like beta-propeller repeat protein [Desulforhopalus sp.]
MKKIGLVVSTLVLAFVFSFGVPDHAAAQVGSEKWAFTTGGWVDSSPAIGADGTIYVGSYDNKLYAINPDGNEKWAFTTGNYVISSPA